MLLIAIIYPISHYLAYLGTDNKFYDNQGKDKPQIATTRHIIQRMEATQYGYNRIYPLSISKMFDCPTHNLDESQYIIRYNQTMQSFMPTNFDCRLFFTQITGYQKEHWYIKSIHKISHCFWETMTIYNEKHT